MIIGAHSVISSTNPEADCALLRDVLKLTNVDAGGYLVFGLPPAEVSVHAGDKNDQHAFYLMCDDVKAFATEMRRHSIVCGPVQDQGWGLVTQLTLPGGGKLGVYEPRYVRPKAMTLRKRAPKTARVAAKPQRRPKERSKRKGK